MKNEVAKMISLALVEKGLSKAELGRLLGTSGQRIGQYVSGRMMPKVDFLQKWKEVFGEDLLIETNVSRETFTRVDEPPAVYSKLIETQEALIAKLEEEVKELRKRLTALEHNAK